MTQRVVHTSNNALILNGARELSVEEQLFTLLEGCDSSGDLCCCDLEEADTMIL